MRSFSPFTLTDHLLSCDFSISFFVNLGLVNSQWYEKKLKFSLESFKMKDFFKQSFCLWSSLINNLKHCPKNSFHDCLIAKHLVLFKRRIYINIVLLHSVLTRLVKVRKSKQFEMASTFKDLVIKTILHRIGIKKPVTTTAVTTTTTFTSTATTAVTTVLTTITETTSAAE